MRAQRLRRLLLAAALLGVGLPSASPAAAQSDDSFGPIVGNWDHHGFFVVVDDDGRSRAIWRVYKWCQDGYAQPCDQIVNNEIISGGRAVIRFSGPDDSGAFQGEVFETTDPQTLDLGPVTLTPQPYDMALLEQGDFQLVMCGENAPGQAPREVLNQCGA
jgi:hypothetical protein